MLEYRGCTTADKAVQFLQEIVMKKILMAMVGEVISLSVVSAATLHNTAVDAGDFTTFLIGGNVFFFSGRSKAC